MKKILAISLFCLAALTAGAQTMYEAINYAETNYYGTARSAALGNAMTAVGSDLGSIGINPAGAAVAGYSQFTITPGLSISSTSSTYAPSTYGTVTGTTPDSQNRFIMPNFGFIMNVDTRRDFGLKNWIEENWPGQLRKLFGEAAGSPEFLPRYSGQQWQLPESLGL